ncbi:MAG: hypothetical protein MUP11_08175 [Anaerolineales bacterium]|nr:hypothetical protein [Anaerolineales bacterium]
MDDTRYQRPESCQQGKDYYFRIAEDLRSVRYKKVKFLSYRPHPAEVLISKEGIPRKIHRIDLYQRRNGKDTE